MNRKAKLAIFVSAFFGVTVAPASIALATTPNRVTPGAPCSTLGATGSHNGEPYVCQQKKADDCPVWHHAPQPGAHGTPWSHGPCSICSATPSPSLSTSASPSASATPKPTQTATPSASPSTPATPTGSPSAAASPTITTGGSLPITGNRSWLLVVAGVALMSAGLFLLLLLRLV